MYVGEEALNLCYAEYKKEGEEIVFECVISGPKQSVTERSIRCPIWPSVPIPLPFPPRERFSNNNPIVVHRTPAVRSVLWFRQPCNAAVPKGPAFCFFNYRAVWGGACK